MHLFFLPSRFWGPSSSSMPFALSPLLVDFCIAFSFLFSSLCLRFSCISATFFSIFLVPQPSFSFPFLAILLHALPHLFGLFLFLSFFIKASDSSLVTTRAPPGVFLLLFEGLGAARGNVRNSVTYKKPFLSQRDCLK